jgi:hypothetical protein
MRSQAIYEGEWSRTFREYDDSVVKETMSYQGTGFCGQGYFRRRIGNYLVVQILKFLDDKRLMVVSSQDTFVYQILVLLKWG